MNTLSHNISLIVKFSDSYKEKIIALADEMAAAASERGPQSYDTLIRARKQLEEQLNKKVDIDTNNQK